MENKQLYHGCGDIFNHEAFYRCECGTEAVMVSHDPDKLCPMIFLSIWTYGHKGLQFGWWQRLRWCWNMLKTGFPYEDEVVLKPETAKALSRDLNMRAEFYEPVPPGRALC